MNWISKKISFPIKKKISGWEINDFFFILTFASVLPFLISFSISFHQYLKTKFQHNLFLCLSWISYFLWALFHGLSKLFLSKSLYWLSGLFITGYLVSIILFGESLESDINLSKNLLFVLILQSLIVISLYNPDLMAIELYKNGDFGIRLTHPVLQFLILIEMLLSSIIVIVIMIKIYINVTQSMKAKTFHALLGVIIFSSLGFSYVFLGGDKLLPGLNMLFTFLGTLLFGISFLKEPKMLHVLSFKTLRLQVIDTNSGIGLYSYSWKAGLEISDEDLFSGMMQGIGLIVQESVKRGEVEEIKLSDGILIIKKLPQSKVACVLVAMKSTAPLRQAIFQFAYRFNEEFKEVLGIVSEVTNFNRAAKIVEECFPFLREE